MENMLTSKCVFTEDDSVGGLCWVWIILSCLSHIIYFARIILLIIDYSDKEEDNEMYKLIMLLFMNIIIFMIQIYIIYNMCKLCRGWTALLIVSIITCIVGVSNFYTMYN